MSRTELKVLQLEKEVELLRSAVVGLVGRDEEGDYRPALSKKSGKLSVSRPLRGTNPLGMERPALPVFQDLTGSIEDA